MVNEIIEQADWFGKTGLDEELERELPRYLRREFSMYEDIDEDEGLRACDLKYLGLFELTLADRKNASEDVFHEELSAIHVWEAYKYQEVLYAYIGVLRDGNLDFFAGDYLPENARK